MGRRHAVLQMTRTPHLQSRTAPRITRVAAKCRYPAICLVNGSRLLGSSSVSLLAIRARRSDAQLPSRA